MISRPLTTSSLRVEALAKASKTRAGRKLANKPSSLRIPRRPRSGCRLKGSDSHLGPPTAPNKIASEFFAAESVSSGNGCPVASMAAPPINPSFTSNLTERRWPIQSTTRRTSAITSGPIPSPGNKSSFLFAATSFALVRKITNHAHG